MTSRVTTPLLTEPGPDGPALATIFEAALRAPDHGRLRPWRFLVMRGAARARFGDVLADSLRAREPETPDDLVERERAKPLRAPLVVVVAAKTEQIAKVPVVEQVVSAGTAAQNMQLAAHALGFGCMWRTGAPAYDPAVKAALGLDPEDPIVGFLYLGTPARRPSVPRKLDARDFVVEWTGPAAAAS